MNPGLIADETTPENEGSNLICPKSPSKKFEEYRLYPVKSRKKLLDILVPLNAVCQKEEQHNQSKLEEDGNFPKLPNRDVNSANNSQSEGSQSRSATQVSASMKESSSQDVILTSTPRDTTQTFDWEVFYFYSTL
ncbi:hypothetical protein Avbf_02780 [Armadillidium vulgare]|nr:hypothetical protein Avbf_02780 [Armadillidium vulgare]